MAIIQPPITGEFMQDSWAYQVTELFNANLDNITSLSSDALGINITDENHTFPAGNDGVVPTSFFTDL